MHKPVTTDILQIKECVDQAGAFLYNQLWFYCPGCGEAHCFHMDGDANKRPMWTFDGDLEKPTMTPSLRIFTHIPNEDGTLGPMKTLCHLELKKGVIEYCGDCPHRLVGQKVPMERFRLFKDSEIK